LEFGVFLVAQSSSFLKFFLCGVCGDKTTL
jgi:hypothetical protein